MYGEAWTGGPVGSGTGTVTVVFQYVAASAERRDGALKILVGVCKSREVGCQFSLGKIGGIESEKAGSSHVPGGNQAVQFQPPQGALDRCERRLDDAAQLTSIAAVEQYQREQHSSSGSSAEGAGFHDTYLVSYDTI